MQTGDLKNVQPGYDDKNKEMPEQQPNSDMQLGEYAQSPDCTNANVVGLPSLSDEYVKLKSFESFSKELSPIISQLNVLLKKYKVYPIEDTITFPVIKNRITPFINYSAFPSSVGFVQGAAM